MEPFGIGMAGLGVAGLSTLGAFGLAFRQRRRRQAVAIPAARAPRSAADRLEALAAAQADLALRLDTLAVQATAPEERLQAMAGQLLGLIRDKNATLETALAGLDQLRARMRALEQMGEPAEARALLETLGQRLDGLQAAQAASAAGLEARLAALAPDSAGLADRLAGLDEKRAAGAEALLGRLTPLETRLAALESGREAERAAGRDALKRLEARLDALGAEQGAARADLATLKAEAAGPVRALGEQLTRVLAQKEALAESLLARIAALEAELAARDQGPALDRLADRLEALRAERAAAEAGLAGRLAAIEGAENPFAAISDQLTRLYAQKDATVETVFARLAPLEAKLAELDPSAALDRFAERLEAVQGRVAALEGGEPVRGDLGQLTALYAQKDATVETVFARLAPLEARLAELDPSAALDRFAERLEAVQGRVAAMEGGEPVRGDLRAADRALRAEGRDGRDGVRPAGAAGGAAGGARPECGARPVRRAAGGGAGPGGGDRGGGEPVRGDLGPADPALRAEGRDGGDGVRAAGAAGGEAGGARPERCARPVRRAAGGGAGPGGDAGRRREPVRGDFRPADRALRAEGRDGGDGVRPAGAAGGEARRDSTRPRRSTASPSGWRRCRAGWRRSRGRRTRSRRSRTS